MRRANIYLSDEQLEALRRISEHRGKPVAQLVREAVDEWLGSQKVRSSLEDEWRGRFGELLARRTQLSGKRGWTEQDVERDVAAALCDVRRARRGVK
jgi:Ribbon-helix-helix protein, copG family